MTDNRTEDTDEMESIQDIASDGDVILVVGKEKVKMRVSSVLLANASPVFKAMFGPHFREGHQLRNVSSSGALEILLPDDHWRSMSLLCRMVHLSYEQGKEAQYPYLLYTLATHIDKYCCVVSLRPQSAALLSTCLKRNEGEWMTTFGLWPLMSAAYLMDCSQAFEIATSRLVLQTKAEFDSTTFDMIPGSIIGMVCEKRAAAWRKFCRDVPALGIPQCYAGCLNEDPEFMQGLARAFQLRYWPPTFERESLRDLLIKTKSLFGPSRIGPSCKHTGLIQVVGDASFCQAAKKIEASCQGLCLVCAKAGVSAFNGICEEHKWNL